MIRSTTMRGGARSLFVGPRRDIGERNLSGKHWRVSNLSMPCWLFSLHNSDWRIGGRHVMLLDSLCDGIVWEPVRYLSYRKCASPTDNGEWKTHPTSPMTQYYFAKGGLVAHSLAQFASAIQESTYPRNSTSHVFARVSRAVCPSSIVKETVPEWIIPTIIWGEDFEHAHEVNEYEGEIYLGTRKCERNHEFLATQRKLYIWLMTKKPSCQTRMALSNSVVNWPEKSEKQVLLGGKHGKIQSC